MKKISTVSTPDVTTDVLAFLTATATLSWSFYILTLENSDIFAKKKDLAYAFASILLMHVAVNLWIISRELLDNRFRDSQWKWILLLHSVVVIMAVVWTLRSVSPASNIWCHKTYKPIFGILVATSSIYFIGIVACGPAFMYYLDKVRSSYNKKKV